MKILKPKWTMLTKKGYLRYTRAKCNGELSNKYVHRAVTAANCRMWCYYPLDRDGLPILPMGSGKVNINHIDHIKLHNCPTNLLILQREIDEQLDKGWVRCPYTGRRMNKEEYVRVYGTLFSNADSETETPEWVA